MKIMSKTNSKETTIFVGVQNIETGTVDIQVNGEVITCPMFQEDDGDYGFIYGTETYYFRYLTTL